MKRLTLTATLAVAVALPASAWAKSPSAQHVRDYQKAYHAVAVKLGRRAPGREIVKWGTDNHHKATDAQVAESLAVLRRMLSPAPVVVRAAYVPPAYVPSGTSTPSSSPAPAPPSSGSSGYTIPSSIVMCESGGSYTAVNPSSGAGGAYQILPSTWSSYGGTGLPQNASPAEQGAIAAKIYAGGAGRGQWSC